MRGPEPFAPHRFCLPPPDFNLVSYYESSWGVTSPMSPEKEQRERIKHIQRWEAENGISMHEAENRFQAWGCWHRDHP